MRASLHLFRPLLLCWLFTAAAFSVRLQGYSGETGPPDDHFHQIALQNYEQAHAEAGVQMVRKEDHDVEVPLEWRTGTMRDTLLQAAHTRGVIDSGHWSSQRLPSPYTRRTYFSSIIRPDDPFAEHLHLRWASEGERAAQVWEALVFWKHAVGEASPLKIDYIAQRGAHYGLSELAPLLSGAAAHVQPVAI